MKAGGGKSKGSRFERDVGRQLSLWVTDGRRADAFARNVLSGGQFTSAQKRGDKEHGSPGDLVSNNVQEALDFLKIISVECKHYADLNFEAFLFDSRLDKSFLGRVFEATAKQCRITKTWPMIIARMDRRDTIILVDSEVGEAMLSNAICVFDYCLMHKRPLFFARFDEVTNMVHAQKFLRELGKLECPT